MVPNVDIAFRLEENNMITTHTHTVYNIHSERCVGLMQSSIIIFDLANACECEKCNSICTGSTYTTYHVCDCVHSVWAAPFTVVNYLFGGIRSGREKLRQTLVPTNVAYCVRAHIWLGRRVRCHAQPFCSRLLLSDGGCRWERRFFVRVRFRVPAL